MEDLITICWIIFNTFLDVSFFTIELLAKNKPMKILLLLLVVLVFTQRQIKIQSFNIETLDPAKYQRPNMASLLKELIYNGDVTLLQGAFNPTTMSQVLETVKERYTMVDKPYQYLFYKTILLDLNLNLNMLGNFRNLPTQFLLNEILLVGYLAGIDFTRTTQEVQILANNRYNTSQVLILGDFTCQFNPTVVNSTNWKFLLANSTTLVNSNCGSDRFLANKKMQEYVVSSRVMLDYAIKYNYSRTQLLTISSHYPIEVNVLIGSRRSPFWIELVTLTSIFGGLFVCVVLLGVIGVILRLTSQNRVPKHDQYQVLEKEVQ